MIGLFRNRSSIKRSDSGLRCDRSMRALALPSSIRYWCQRQNPNRRLPRVFAVIRAFVTLCLMFFQRL